MKNKIDFSSFCSATVRPALLALAVVGTARAGEGGGEPEAPTFETQTLFTAGDAGYHAYRIPAIAVTPGGAVLVAVAGRFDSASDWANADVMLRRSDDGGRTWDEPRALVNDGANTVDNPTFIVDAAAGATHLMYQINYARAFLKTSRDDGATWSPPREITSAFEEFRNRDGYKRMVLAMGPGHGIALASGRLVVPVWLATDRSHRPSISSTIYSDDRGATWHAGEIIARHSDETPNPSEHELVELADGRVLANLRTESKRHRRVVSTSPDGIAGWSKPEFVDDLYEPICMGSMLRLSGSDAVLFSNPNSGPRGSSAANEGSRERRNLTVRLSEDGGQSWPVLRVVASGPAGYSDLAASPGGDIYLLYESGRTESSGPFVPAGITLAKFNRAWLTDGGE